MNYELNNLPLFADSRKPSMENLRKTNSVYIYLIRHGQSEGNASNRFGGHSATPLSALGREQSVGVAERLADEGITKIYSSDLPRAVQTAEPLAQKLGLPIYQTDAFRERNIGVLQGLKFNEAAAEFPLEYEKLIERDLDFELPQGESYRQVIERADGKLNEIIIENPNGKIAVFAHTGTICLLILQTLGALENKKRVEGWIKSDNCGVTCLKFSEAAGKSVLYVNR